jgi:predicted DNA-binding protein
VLYIELPYDIEERLVALARMHGRTPAFYAIEAIRAYLDDLALEE